VSATRKKFIDWNEKMFVRYNNLRLYGHPNPVIRYTEAKRVSKILDAIGGAERVADVGCGEGYVLARIRAPQAVGLDISKAALRMAAKCTSATLVRADGESMPFSDSFFDAVVCSEMLEHTTHPAKVVSEIARITRPGGRVVLTIPNEPLINAIKGMAWNLGIFNIVFPDVPRRQDEEWHLHSFDLQMLRKLCGRALKIEAVHGVPFGFLSVRYVAVCRNAKGGPMRKDGLFSRKVRRAGAYFDAIR
jgi:SAM-dependent methyltransferase